MHIIRCAYAHARLVSRSQGCLPPSPPPPSPPPLPPPSPPSFPPPSAPPSAGWFWGDVGVNCKVTCEAAGNSLICDNQATRELIHGVIDYRLAEYNDQCSDITVGAYERITTKEECEAAATYIKDTYGVITDTTVNDPEHITENKFLPWGCIGYSGGAGDLYLNADTSNIAGIMTANPVTQPAIKMLCKPVISGELYDQTAFNTLVAAANANKPADQQVSLTCNSYSNPTSADYLPAYNTLTNDCFQVKRDPSTYAFGNNHKCTARRDDYRRICHCITMLPPRAPPPPLNPPPPPRLIVRKRTLRTETVLLN